MGANDLYYEAIAKFSELLVQSEKRIEATNAMVCKLADTCEHNHNVLEKLVSEYSTRIDNLRESRDEVVKQNSQLIEILGRAQQQSMKSDERVRTLIDRILDKVQLGNNTSKSDIHIEK